MPRIQSLLDKGSFTYEYFHGVTPSSSSSTRSPSSTSALSSGARALHGFVDRHSVVPTWGEGLLGVLGCWGRRLVAERRAPEWVSVGWSGGVARSPARVRRGRGVVGHGLERRAEGWEAAKRCWESVGARDDFCVCARAEFSLPRWSRERVRLGFTLPSMQGGGKEGAEKGGSSANLYARVQCVQGVWVLAKRPSPCIPDPPCAKRLPPVQPDGGARVQGLSQSSQDHDMKDVVRPHLLQDVKNL